MRTLIFRNENDTFHVEYKTDMVEAEQERFTIMEINEKTTGVNTLQEHEIKAGVPLLPLEASLAELKALAADLNLQLVERTTSASNVLVDVDVPLAFVTTSPLTSGTHSVAYAGETMEAEGGSGTYTFAVADSGDALPSGLTMTTAGVIAGTPGSGTAGTYDIDITVTDSYGMTVTDTFTLVIA